MVNCEMCGRRGEQLSYSVIEGVKLQVCSKCAGFGKFAGNVVSNVVKEDDSRKFEFNRKDEEDEELVVEDFASILRNKREKLGLSQKDFAMKINEKESFVASLENGKTSLSLETAKKLEKLLHVVLVFKQKAVHLGKTEKMGAITIGDLLNRK